MNELQLYRHKDPSSERGNKTVYIGPDHPGYAGFCPIPGIGLASNDQTIIEARELICAVAEGRPQADFAFGHAVTRSRGHAVTRVVDAIEKSTKEQRWVRLDEI